ncbi:hypothetical protein [Clostridium estertheticum]|uniref:Uncharacterized protein n=1 Tax=Clostridium estertheticum subsp. estertheticum TaxID=1552 RepID=A0A1J0GHS7_9CLOT|nr:hypothetical protein [Clostridium estertheticum]APC40831.1 hypothetical protein A7L45_12485 [Clostridium estertheticum subsp. estertheticum]MBZ9617319.1 hypothetical protein [Clostridium estertheticum subsp. laramiense]WAG73006.1 hypothetical protein LL032_17910 [Clostridium estertheticum]
MRNLLVGNGINIQYDNVSYTNQNIVLRILTALDESDYPYDFIVNEPLLLKYYLGRLFLFAREMLDGVIDDSITCTAERKALGDFKERYKTRKKSLRITDIGFEDYYLVHDLVCHKFKIINPEQYTIRESMRMSYLFSIYNHGKLNLLHEKYSDSFKTFLSNFDNIFSTNYDNNIEAGVGKHVYHIHGQFDRLSEVYNPSSFRNQLHDNPLEGIPNDPTYDYLHSTALSTYCGDYKQYQIKQASLANEAVNKMTNAYLSNELVSKDVDSWENENNKLIVNFADAIKIKVTNPNLRFQEDYSIEEFRSITGTLSILGLSPYNDYHLFEIIDNAKINECIYYFFDSSECNIIEKLLLKLKAEKKLEFKSVKEFWGICNEKNKVYQIF